MMLHELKTWPPCYQAVASGRKTFEVREDDRDFKVGDRLLLREWDPDLRSYTGRKLTCEITYKLDGGDFGVMEGYCALAIARVS